MCLLAIAIASVAAEPTTTPSKVSDEQLTRWLANLESASPDTRESAAMSLLHLSPDTLPRLRIVTERAKPLSPAQAQVLYDVVTHVFLSGEPYEKTDMGFLGMMFAPVYRFGMDPRVEGQGVVVQSRIPGLGAYSGFLDGDIVLSMDELPGVWLTDSQSFAEEVRKFPPGTTLHFQILRQGRQLHTEATLSARPAALRPDSPMNSVVDFQEGRAQTAQEYWDKNFGPITQPAYSQAD